MWCSNQHNTSASVNLSPWGVSVPHVCFPRDGIHPAAPSHAYPAKYCLFQAKGYPPAWFPSQLWGAGVESLGLRRTWPGPVSGAVNIHLPHGLATWVVSRFGGQCHFAPSDCAPHRFAVSEGALRERLSDVQSRDAGLPITQPPCDRPGSSQAEAHVYHQDWEWSLQTSFTLYLA